MKLPDFFGLDIGNHTIKVCQVKWGGQDAELVALGSFETPVGILGSENEAHQRLLAETINKAVESAGIRSKNVIVALPESAIFTRILQGYPKLEPEKLNESIVYEAKKYIPIPLDETRLDWMVVGEKIEGGATKLDILVVAAAKSMVERYTKILKITGLEALALETDSIATSRAISYKRIDNKTTVMVLDFGANGTDLSVIKGDNLLFSQTLGTGSDALTRAIAADYNLDFTQAEQYKRAYGLDPSQAQGKIAGSLIPIMQIVITEVNKTMEFFKSRFTDSIPQQIFLVGDGSKLIYLSQYLTEQLKLNSVLADPFERFKITQNLQNLLTQHSAAGYTVAAGLAMKRE